MSFDEEHIDPHGQCAAEIHRLQAEIKAADMRLAAADALASAAAAHIGRNEDLDGFAGAGLEQAIEEYARLEIRPPIHAAIPDGEVDEIRKRDSIEHALKVMNTPLICSASGIPYNDFHLKERSRRIAALEAEKAALKNDYEAEQRKRMFLHWSLVAIRAEGIEKPKDRAAEIAKARAVLKTLGNPKLEREISDAVNDNAALKAEVAEARAKAIEECLLTAKTATNRLKCPTCYDTGIGGALAAIRSLSTSQGETR